MDPCFFHIDVNSAFLSWTAVDRLAHGDTVDLREVPSIIGGDQSSRHGIVLAKSIPAKKYHIETAEPIVNAFKKYPDLIMAPPDMKLYHRMSKQMMDYLHSFTDDIEQASVDEVYLDFAPIAHLYESPLSFANMIRETIYSKFGFTVNVGISDVKVLAKMASDFTKPNKTHTLYRSEIKEKMWPLPVGDLFLCGKSAQATLKKLEINTIGDLATANPDVLNSHLKSMGALLQNFANGIDDSVVNTQEREAKGIGNSTTGSHDITTKEEASKVIYSLCESVSLRLKKAGFLAGSVTVEIKYADFKSFSHQTGLERPIYTAKALHEAAMPLFDALWNQSPIRLLGVRATKLVSEDEPMQLSLFDDCFSIDNSSGQKSIADDLKEKKLESALSSIRDKYGKNAIRKGM
ncbi:MAG: DNA polymerase IV [Lachnospiraceae bacterium]|nr:DNA polymerase IV [Lachnospiraceae bacterium]